MALEAGFDPRTVPTDRLFNIVAVYALRGRDEAGREEFTDAIEELIRLYEPGGAVPVTSEEWRPPGWGSDEDAERSTMAAMAAFGRSRAGSRRSRR